MKTPLHKHSRVVGSRWAPVLIREDLKILIIFRCNYKGSTFSSVIVRPSNSRPPAWQPDAQPTDPPVRGGIELQRSSIFFKGRGGGGGEGDVDRSWGHPHVMPGMALWLTCSHVELFCNFVSRFEVYYFLKLW